MDSTCQYYFYQDGQEDVAQYERGAETSDGLPSLVPLSSFEGQSECQGVSFVPPRCMEAGEGELVRALRFNGKQAEFISFKMPKRFGQIQLSRTLENEQVSYQDWATGDIPKDGVYKDYER